MTGKVRAALLTAMVASLAVAVPTTALHDVATPIADVSASPDHPDAASAGTPGPADPRRRAGVEVTVTIAWPTADGCLDGDGGLVTDGAVHPIVTPAGDVRPPIAGAATETSPRGVSVSTAGEQARAHPTPPAALSPACRSRTLSSGSLRAEVQPVCVDAPMDRSTLCAGVEDATVWVDWSAGGRLRTLDRAAAAPGPVDAGRSTGERPSAVPEQETPRSGQPTPAATSSGGGRAPLPGSTDDPIWLGSAVGAALGALGLLWLYRRLTDADILDHDLRSKILEISDAEPGIHVAALAKRLDVAPRTVHYHVRVLEEAGHVLVKDRGGQRMILVAKAGPDRLAREAICALRQDGKRELLRTLAVEPGLSLTEIARRIDRHPSTVKRHADDLVERGLVDAVRDGAARRLRLVEAAAAHVRDRA